MNSLSVNAKYTIGIIVWMTLYVAALFLSILVIKSQAPTGPLLYALAVLPALPVGGTIWVFLRYIDKVDEYVRAVVTKRFILATGLTLFVCTAWGFLENNAGAHEFSLYLVYPLWWGLFGLSSVFYRNAQ
jgi:hypothetical protein